jgi:hypothetical protein
MKILRGNDVGCRIWDFGVRNVRNPKSDIVAPQYFHAFLVKIKNLYPKQGVT